MYIHALVFSFQISRFMRARNFDSVLIRRLENFVQNQEMDIEIRKRDKDYLMTDFEAAELAKVPVNTIRYWRQTGIMPFVKVGRHPRIWLSTFEKVFQKPGLNSLDQFKTIGRYGE